MQKKTWILLICTTGLVITITLLIKKYAECYPGFTPFFKTAKDGCDLAYFLSRIGYLPQTAIILIALFIYLKLKKK